jgi:hypothetical protein
MIGPLTLQVGKIVDEYYNRLGYVVASKLATMIDEGQRHIDFPMRRIPLLVAARGVYRSEEVSPEILWGNFWFLYYQAWLWKFSKEWRENVMEVWLKRLHDKGELEKLLIFYQVEND